MKIGAKLLFFTIYEPRFRSHDFSQEFNQNQGILTELPHMGQKWGETRKWPNLTKLGWCDPFMGRVDPAEYFWSGGPPVGGAAPP